MRCLARSWTGRICILSHSDDVHQAADGARWRGNADDVPDGGASAIPEDVRASFLGFVEASTAVHGGRPDNGSRAAAWDALCDALAKHCGVTWGWNELFAWYWAGDWPSEWLSGGEYHDVMPNALVHQSHCNIWDGRPWGCAVERPWGF